MKIKSIQSLSWSFLVAGFLMGTVGMKAYNPKLLNVAPVAKLPSEVGSTQPTQQSEKQPVTAKTESNQPTEKDFELFAACVDRVNPLSEKIWGKLEQLFLEKPTFINAKDSKGRAPLHLAIVYKNPAVFTYLVEKKGADLTVKDSSGRSLIEFAKKFQADKKEIGGRVAEIIEFLEKKQQSEKQPVTAKIESNQPPVNKILRFQYLIMQSPGVRVFMAMDKLLIDYPLLIDATYDKGPSPLEAAILERNLDAFKYLVEKGANLNIKSSDGLTLLEFAKNTLKDLQLKTFKFGNADKEIA